MRCKLGGAVLKNRFILLVFSACLILLFTSCGKQEIKETVKPFEDISIDLVKSADFSNYTLRSEEKELGRTKTITEKRDVEEIVKYIKTISCTESTRKIKDADFEIRLIDNKGSYIYSIGVSKNQIFMYGGINSITFVYDYSDTKVIKELARIYKEMNYREIFIIGV